MDLISLHDYADAAKSTMPGYVWDYLEGGSWDELTAVRNQAGFAGLTLRPRYVRDVSERDLSTTMLGTELSLPVFLSPAGQQRQAHERGEAETAMGAAKAGTLMIVPGGQGDSIEAVAAEAPGPLWLQLFHRSREFSEEMIKRAEAAGYLAICLTVDVPLNHTKERDVRNEFIPPYEARLGEGDPKPTIPFQELSRIQATWDDIEWLTSLTSLPIVLKGIITAEDAQLAVEHGVSGLIVSTHGGRIFDGTLSSIESLPEVVGAVGGRIEVYLDSGVRRGIDVLKALALGARAVGIGRPFFWGLKVDGAAGVAQILEILRAEFDLALGFCGQKSARSLEANLVNVPRDWGAGGIA